MSASLVITGPGASLVNLFPSRLKWLLMLGFPPMLLHVHRDQDPPTLGVPNVWKPFFYISGRVGRVEAPGHPLSGRRVQGCLPMSLVIESTNLYENQRSRRREDGTVAETKSTWLRGWHDLWENVASLTSRWFSLPWFGELGCTCLVLLSDALAYSYHETCVTRDMTIV